MYICICICICVYVHTDLNSLPFLLTLSKPHSPRTAAVAPHELRCDSPAHSENKTALCLHGVHSPLVPPLSHTPRCRWYALRSLSPSLSLSAASDRLLAAGEQVGSGTTTSERRGRREGREGHEGRSTIRSKRRCERGKVSSRESA